MGKYSKGIIGVINGLIGAVADSTWKGIDYMHSRPQKSKAAALRQELQYTMLLPANFSGDELPSYLFFVSTKGKQLSNSVYIWCSKSSLTLKNVLWLY